MDKNLLKKLLIIVGGFLGVLILFLIVASVIKGVTNKKNSYEKIKINASNAAEKYYDSLKEKLNSGESIEVTFDELVSKKYMKEYTSKLDDGVKCSGKVVISNNFDNMLYTSIMDCGKAYKDETLSEHIINNNEIVTSGDGIYDLYGRYIYRGEKVNNYIEFDGKIWYIVDIEKNGKIRLLSSESSSETEIPWDDRYNISEEYDAGYNDYPKSRIRENLEELAINNSVVSLNSKRYVSPQDICVGKRNINETDNSNAVDCSETVKSQMLGTLTPSDVITASIDPYCNSIGQNQCVNYNYFYEREFSDFWMLVSNSENNHSAFYCSNAIVDISETSEYMSLYTTIKLTPEAQYLSGDGTESNPYRIVEN